MIGIKKIVVTGRVPEYVKEYSKKNGVTISDLIMAGFDYYRATDKDHALERLDYHEKRVLHWRHIVLQDEEACNTKHHICNTIKKDFKKAGRGHKDTRRMDMNWCNAKAEHLVEEGIIISGKDLYAFCIKEEK